MRLKMDIFAPKISQVKNNRVTASHRLKITLRLEDLIEHWDAVSIVAGDIVGPNKGSGVVSDLTNIMEFDMPRELCRQDLNA